MRSHALTRLGLIAALALSLAACGVGQRQSPVGTDDEAGQTKPVQIEEDKPSFYVTKSGDTLRSIAGREEIYGEPDLWPLILDANADALGAQTRQEQAAGGHPPERAPRPGPGRFKRCPRKGPPGGGGLQGPPQGPRARGSGGERVR